MKKILSLLIISSFCCAAPAMAQDHAEKDCILNIKAIPWATVNIDGERFGTTPIKKTVSCDEHDVELRMPSKNAEVHKIVAFDHGNSETIEYDFRNSKWVSDEAKDKKAAPAAAVQEQDVRAIKDKLNKSSHSDTALKDGACSIMVKATPWATVNIDQSRIGTTPIKKEGISCGLHKIELGYPSKNKSVVQQIKLEKGKVTIVSFDWAEESWNIQTAKAKYIPAASKKGKEKKAKSKQTQNPSTQRLSNSKIKVPF